MMKRGSVREFGKPRFVIASGTSPRDTRIRSGQYSIFGQGLDVLRAISEKTFEHVRVVLAESRGGPFGCSRRARELSRPPFHWNLSQARMFELHEVSPISQLRI